MYEYLVYAMWISWALIVWCGLGAFIGCCVEAMGGDGSVDGHVYWLKRVFILSGALMFIVSFIKDTSV